VKDGIATGEGGMGLWWYKARMFKDFVLRGEYLQEKGGMSDSGIFLRFPDPGSNPMVGVKQGHEMEIGENKADKHGTGSIYPFQGATWLPVKPEGEWNAYEITCVGRTYDIRLNGHLVNRFVDNQHCIAEMFENARTAVRRDRNQPLPTLERFAFIGESRAIAQQTRESRIVPAFARRFTPELKVDGSYRELVHRRHVNRFQLAG
jgi:hypothetical protein